MSAVSTSSDITVQLLSSMASDNFVIETAQVSIGGVKEGTEPVRLINKLMKERHGVPFEHNYFRFHIECPLFTAEQIKKHRISSINEFSLRYSQMIPRFYVPTMDRPMINVGTKMEPKMAAGTVLQASAVRNEIAEQGRNAWTAYQRLLKLGVAEEIARAVLPTATFTKMHFTLNARSLMNFLERRTEDEVAKVKSHPQYEIRMVAEQMEEYFQALMPLSHAAWVQAGRVTP